jgi:hypothetical protein
MGHPVLTLNGFRLYRLTRSRSEPRISMSVLVCSNHSKMHKAFLCQVKVSDHVIIGLSQGWSKIDWVIYWLIEQSEGLIGVDQIQVRFDIRNAICNTKSPRNAQPNKIFLYVYAVCNERYAMNYYNRRWARTSIHIVLIIVCEYVKSFCHFMALVDLD